MRYRCTLGSVEGVALKCHSYSDSFRIGGQRTVRLGHTETATDGDGQVGVSCAEPAGWPGKAVRTTPGGDRLDTQAPYPFQAAVNVLEHHRVARGFWR